MMMVLIEEAPIGYKLLFIQWENVLKRNAKEKAYCFNFSFSFLFIRVSFILVAFFCTCEW